MAKNPYDGVKVSVKALDVTIVSVLIILAVIIALSF